MHFINIIDHCVDAVDTGAANAEDEIGSGQSNWLAVHCIHLRI
jgi:hypothetical protein